MKRALQSANSNQRRELRRLNAENETLHRDNMTLTASRNFFETQAAHGGAVIHRVQKHFENLAHECEMYKGACVFCGRSALENMKRERRKRAGRDVQPPRIGGAIMASVDGGAEGDMQPLVGGPCKTCGGIYFCVCDGA